MISVILHHHMSPLGSQAQHLNDAVREREHFVVTGSCPELATTVDLVCADLSALAIQLGSCHRDGFSP